MSGGASGNVYAIWNDGQFVNDTTNANSYALIAGVNQSCECNIELDASRSYFANGEPTGSNGFANTTVVGNNYTLINFTQFSDTGTGDTFAGTLGWQLVNMITAQTEIRTTTSDNTALYVGNTGTNGKSIGNVDVTQFTGSSVNEGFVTYQAGSRTFRQFQLKFIVNNSKPNEFDFTIDKFRYSIERIQ